jgi:hypothetical protein
MIAGPFLRGSIHYRQKPLMRRAEMAYRSTIPLTTHAGAVTEDARGGVRRYGVWGEQTRRMPALIVGVLNAIAAYS